MSGSVAYYYEGEKRVVSIPWLVRNLFPAKSVNLIVGESQAGKTFLALDLAVAIASGRPFFGQPTTQGGVLYIAAEGILTIPGRLKAARQGIPPGEKLIAVIDQPPPNLMNESEIDQIIAVAKIIDEEMRQGTGLPLSAVFIDTLMSAFVISNWNEPGETTLAMKMLNRIKEGTGTTVIGVHHHGKDRSRGAAGSYALTAAPDSILSVFKKGNEGMVTGRYITLTKSRFGETARKLAFELDTLPPDQREEEGDDQAFIVPLLGDKGGDESKSNKAKQSGSQGDDCFQAAYEIAFRDQGEDGRHLNHRVIRAVRLSAVKDRFMKIYKPKGGGDPADASRKAWKRALDKLEANLKSSFEYARKLMQAKDISEVMQLQSDFLRNQFGVATDQFKQMTGGVASAAKDISKDKPESI